MALTESGQTNISVGVGSDTVAVPINDNIGLVCYDDDTGNVRSQARVLDVSSGSLSVGAANEIGVDNERVGDIFSHANNAAILAYDDNDAGGLSLRVLTRSGTTITENTEYLVESAANSTDFIRVACSNSTVGLVVDHKAAGPHRLCRFTITGTTLLVGTPQDHAGDATGFPVAIEVIDTNRLLYFYRGSAASEATFQVINIVSGISEGTPSVLSGVVIHATGNRSRKMLAKLSASKFLAVYTNDQATDRIEAVIINVSGDSISSLGTPLQILATSGVVDPSVYVISSTKVIIIYRGASSATRVQTLNISGNTITDGGDAISLTQPNAAYTSIPVLISGKAVTAYLNDTDSEAYVSLISGVPPGGSFARFYQGTGILTERFTLPFAGVQPQGMTLDKSLGAVVMGANAPADQPIIYSTSPYVTGTASGQGFPTGSSVSALKWI